MDTTFQAEALYSLRYVHKPMMTVFYGSESHVTSTVCFIAIPEKTEKAFLELIGQCSFAQFRERRYSPVLMLTFKKHRSMLHALRIALITDSQLAISRDANTFVSLQSEPNQWVFSDRERAFLAFEQDDVTFETAKLFKNGRCERQCAIEASYFSS